MLYILGIYTGESSLRTDGVKVGDVIDYRPYSANYRPPPTQSKRFVYVVFDAVTREQVDALIEPQINTGHKVISDYTSGGKKVFEYPSCDAKRRFSIRAAQLRSLGLSDVMFDQSKQYFGGLRGIQHGHLFDKLRQRNVLQTDGLNVFKPELDNVSLP